MAAMSFQGADPFAGTPAARDASVAWMTIMGIPQGGGGVDKYQSLEDYSKAPADEAWVFSCVQRIFNAAASVPLKVYVRQGKELIDAADQPSQQAEDLQYLLDTVNPVDMTGSELRGYLAASRKVWGGWYLKKVRGRFGGATQELYWLRVPDVTPQSMDGRSIYNYQYHPLGAPLTDIDPRMMIRKRGLNLRNQVEMISPLSAARYDMVVDQAAPLHTASTLQRRGVPEGYWKAAQGTTVTKQDQSAIRRWLKQLVGPRNAGRSLVSPDIEYVPLGLPEKDAEWLAARKVSRMTVCAVLGVPLVLAGDDEKAGVYASVRDAQKVFWKDTMIPELDADADALNNWLTPEFLRPAGPRLVIAYDYSHVEALRPLWMDEWNGYMSAIDHQAIVPNEFRRHFDLGPDVPWGDQPTPKTTVAVREEPTAPQTPAISGVTESEANVVTETETLQATLRAFGANLYKHPSVKAFVAFGGPLDADTLLGVRVADDVRRVVESGLRARKSGPQIASLLEAQEMAV